MTMLGEIRDTKDIHCPQGHEMTVVEAKDTNTYEMYCPECKELYMARWLWRKAVWDVRMVKAPFDLDRGEVEF